MSTLSEQLIQMKTVLTDIENESKSLQGGKKASGARARKSLMKLKKQSHNMRKSITEHTKSLPAVKVEEVEEVKDEPVVKIKKTRKPRKSKTVDVMPKIQE